MAARERRGTPTPSSVRRDRDLDVACQTLEELKKHLEDISRLGGGKPTAGLLLAAADDCTDAVIIADDHAEIRMVNGAAARLTGLSTRELQSLTIWDITHSASQVDFDVLWKEFLRSGKQRGHYSVRHKDGSAIEVAYCSEANVLPRQHVSVLRKQST